MMRLTIIAALIALAGPVQAQLLYGISQSSSGGGSVTPPSCNNSLDFSQACNSVYWGLVL